MPLQELLDLYGEMDVCFDQVGTHWIGAVGAYAMWLGIPLVANAEPGAHIPWWPVETPVCQAASAADVRQQLERLLDPEVREVVARESMLFAEEYFGPMRTLHEMLEFD